MELVLAPKHRDEQLGHVVLAHEPAAVECIDDTGSVDRGRCGWTGRIGRQILGRLPFPSLGSGGGDAEQKMSGHSNAPTDQTGDVGDEVTDEGQRDRETEPTAEHIGKKGIPHVVVVRSVAGKSGINEDPLAPLFDGRNSLREIVQRSDHRDEIVGVTRQSTPMST